MSFVNIFLLAIYFVCFSDYGSDVRQKANLAIFSFKFKTGYEAAGIAHNIKNTFGSETAKECTMQQWFMKLCKGEGSLENEECSS